MAISMTMSIFLATLEMGCKFSKAAMSQYKIPLRCGTFAIAGRNIQNLPDFETKITAWKVADDNVTDGRLQTECSIFLQHVGN